MLYESTLNIYLLIQLGRQSAMPSNHSINKLVKSAAIVNTNHSSPNHTWMLGMLKGIPELGRRKRMCERRVMLVQLPRGD